jgi:hypothetical protein
MVDMKRMIRVVCLIIILVSVVLLSQSYVTATGRSVTDETPGARSESALSTTTTSPASTPSGLDRRPTAARTQNVRTPTRAPDSLESRLDRSDASNGDGGLPARGLTVVTTHGFSITKGTIELIVFDANGAVVYHDDRYESYFDVDPVPGTTHTIEYVAATKQSGDACDDVEVRSCTRNVIERVNLSTGAIETVFARKTPGIHNTRWHDADRLNETHRVLANIYRDTVEVVDVRNDTVTWRWHASVIYNRSQGGGESDWTHINDVEVLCDGRIMASMRNMDEVVFLRPDSGVIRNATLGTDEDHDILYEQHNPDYIPQDRGGPAVIVADSENSRILEYHREDGEWRTVWWWRDARLQWPRDADRLPNGNTLVVDSYGGRVIEIAPNGSIVWKVHVGMGYDAERLGTGDESTGGEAYGTDRRQTGVRGTTKAGGAKGVADLIVLRLKGLLPSVVVNGLLYLSPSWVRFTDLLVAGVLLMTVMVRIGFAWRWSGKSVRGVADGVSSRILRQ